MTAPPLNPTWNQTGGLMSRESGRNMEPRAGNQLGAPRGSSGTLGVCVCVCVRIYSKWCLQKRTEHWRKKLHQWQTPSGCRENWDRRFPSPPSFPSVSSPRRSRDPAGSHAVSTSLTIIIKAHPVNIPDPVCCFSLHHEDRSQSQVDF